MCFCNQVSSQVVHHVVVHRCCSFACELSPRCGRSRRPSCGGRCVPDEEELCIQAHWLERTSSETWTGAGSQCIFHVFLIPEIIMMKKKKLMQSLSTKTFEKDAMIKVILNWEERKSMFNQNEFNLSYGDTDIAKIRVCMGLCYPRSAEHCALLERTLNWEDENSCPVPAFCHEDSSVTLGSSDNLCAWVSS